MKLHLCFRAYPGISKEPVFSGTKLETVSKCFESMCVSLTNSDFEIQIDAILDNCEEEFRESLTKLAELYCIDLKFHSIALKSNAGTFSMQMGILSNSKADLVGFIEDDYFFEESCFPTLFASVTVDQRKSFYTLFNSCDYSSLAIHADPKQTHNLADHKWKEVNSTTLTFFCSPALLKKHMVTFQTFSENNNDFLIWLMITGRWRRTIFRLLYQPKFKNMIRIFKLIKFRAWSVKDHTRLLCSSYGQMLHLDKDGFSADHLHLIDNPAFLKLQQSVLRN